MLPTSLKITLIIAMLFYFVLILYFLKKKAISLKYTLLWIFAGIVLGTMVIYPRFLAIVTTLLGIESTMNGLYVIAIAFIIAILMSITSIVSRQTAKIQKLTQAVAVLEKRIRELENNDKDCAN